MKALCFIKRSESCTWIPGHKFKARKSEMEILIELKQSSLSSGKKPMLRLSQCWEHKAQHPLKAEGAGQTQTVIYRSHGPDVGLNKWGFKVTQRCSKRFPYRFWSWLAFWNSFVLVFMNREKRKGILWSLEKIIWVFGKYAFCWRLEVPASDCLNNSDSGSSCNVKVYWIETIFIYFVSKEFKMIFLTFFS